VLRHGGQDLRRLENLREERLIHQHALQDAEQQVVEEWARVRQINDEIDQLLDGMPKRETT
jgi:hypothetical protein